MTSINNSEQFNSNRYEEILSILQKLDVGQEKSLCMGKNYDDKRKFLKSTNDN